MLSNNQYEVLNGINLFDKTNKKLRKYFLFFFIVSVCGYLSIIISGCAHSDDYCRYMVNSHVGTASSARYTACFLELLIYFSNVITDAAPFSHILSCAFLAYTAVIFMKIFNVDENDRSSLLCLVPIIVNPYTMENMMYRFDNPFMTLALLCSTTSAYLSMLSQRRFLFMQIALLLQSLLLYQTSISAYLLVFGYFLLLKFSVGEKKLFREFKGWFITLATASICYCPFMINANYCRHKNGNILIIPLNMENILCICKNISIYFSNLKNDWQPSTIGNIFFALVCVFSASFLIEAFLVIKRKYVYKTFVILLLLFLFFLAPLGICAFMYVISFENNTSIPPRIIYCFGIFISMILYRNYSLAAKNNFLKKSYTIFLFFFAMWSMVFTNSAGNIIYRLRLVQQEVLYDVAKDFSEIIHHDNCITYVCIRGDVYTQAVHNFSELYPVMNRIIPEKWNVPIICMLGLYSQEFSKKMLKYIPISEKFIESNYVSKEKLKTHLWYDVYLFDKKVLLFDLRNNVIHRNHNSGMARIK